MAARSAEEFPSRQYAYSRAEVAAGLEAPLTLPEMSFERGAVYRFVLGRDPVPQKLAAEQLERTLQDPFARLVLHPGQRPQTLRALLGILSRSDSAPEGLPMQETFVVADGGQIPWSSQLASVKRSFRFLVTRGRPGEVPPLLVSSSSAFDSEATFLQVIGWDAAASAYQFYDRRQGAWIWAGGSWDALAADSRGQGPFDSHVNGALNMKELKPPWLHWHSQAARIQDDVLAPDDPLRAEPLWQARAPAERLETNVVRPGIVRWTEARVRVCQSAGRLTRLPEFLRQVLETTTVNLASSLVESQQLRAGRPLRLPLTFFINSDALVDTLGLDPGITELPTVDGGIYRDCLAEYDVALTDGDHRVPGDTHFAFVVPEPAFEDLVVLQKLRALDVLPDKLAASLLMVDFCNPVFSTRRAPLLAHVPASAATGAGGDFAATFVGAVRQAASTRDPGSPEHEFLANWDLPDDTWRREFEGRLERFLDAVRARLGSRAAFAPVFELADSRRREFRRRKLAEFRLTTPISRIPEKAPFLQFTPDGGVRAK